MNNLVGIILSNGGLKMKQGVMIHIEEKCRLYIDRGYDIIDCEEQYVDFYTHCLESLGCEITKNTHNTYLSFIPYEKADISQDGIFKLWEEKKILSERERVRNAKLTTGIIFFLLALLLSLWWLL